MTPDLEALKTLVSTIEGLNGHDPDRYAQLVGKRDAVVKAACDALPVLERLLAGQQELVAYWCIEWPDQLHVENGVVSKRTVWCGLRSDAQPTDSMPYIEWVTDTSKAIRFTRKEDAEAVTRLIGLCAPVAMLVTEHLDVAAPPVQEAGREMPLPAAPKVKP